MEHSKLDRTCFPGRTNSVAGNKWEGAICARRPIDDFEGMGTRGFAQQRNDVLSRVRLALLRFLSNGIFISSGTGGRRPTAR